VSCDDLSFSQSVLIGLTLFGLVGTINGASTEYKSTECLCNYYFVEAEEV
jgi:hypothetical protein